jgi:hypothetical protein
LLSGGGAPAILAGGEATIDGIAAGEGAAATACDGAAAAEGTAIAPVAAADGSAAGIGAGGGGVAASIAAGDGAGCSACGAEGAGAGISASAAEGAGAGISACAAEGAGAGTGEFSGGIEAPESFGDADGLCTPPGTPPVTRIESPLKSSELSESAASSSGAVDETIVSRAEDPGMGDASVVGTKDSNVAIDATAVAAKRVTRG